MRLRTLLAALLLLSASAATAAEPSASKLALRPAPAGSCPALPKVRAGPLPFPSGESLSYEVDVMGARAGKMTFDVLPRTGRGADAEIPVRVRAESNSFFTKVRKISSEVTSFLRPRDLRPARFHEDLAEGALTRVADVLFRPDKTVEVTWQSNRDGRGGGRYGYANDALDYVGGIFLFRGIPLRVGEPFCFDAYAIKRMWRVEGKVEAKEHVSVPAGEFEAFHLAGVATSANGKLRREVHVWISDDARRLPLAAVGVIDLGPVRATLTEVQRPDLKTSAPRKSMEW